jgi:hypothetical protein
MAIEGTGTAMSLALSELEGSCWRRPAGDEASPRAERRPRPVAVRPGAPLVRQSAKSGVEVGQGGT